MVQQPSWPGLLPSLAHLLRWLLPSPAAFLQQPSAHAAASLTSSTGSAVTFAVLLQIDFVKFGGFQVFHPIVVFLYGIAPFGFESSPRTFEECQPLLPLLGAFAFSGLGEAGLAVEFVAGFMRLRLGSFGHFLPGLLKCCLGSNQRLPEHLEAAAVVVELDELHFSASATSEANPWPTIVAS